MTPKDLPELPEPECASAYHAETLVYAAEEVLDIQREAYDLGARSTAAQPVEPAGWRLTRSIIHECPALVVPQTWVQKLGMTAQLVVLKGADEALAQRILSALNAAPPAASGDSTPPSAPVQGDPSGALRPEPEAVDPGSLSPDDVAYPRDLFDELIHRGSPYAFYLFQWVPYQTDARRWRLKMLHDVRTFDGREALGIWPNGSHCGPFRDDEVEFIRISRKQHCGEWIDPRKVPEPPQAASGERGD